MAAKVLTALLVGLGAAPCGGVRHAWDKTKEDEYGLKCMKFDGDNVDDYVTAIVSTSVRKEDSTGVGLQVLKDTIGSIRDVLGFKRAHIVVAWDALPESGHSGTEVLSSSTKESYEQKMEDFEEWGKKELGSQLIMFKNEEWTHQAEMLRRVFEQLIQKKQLTPIVYLAQDDSPVMGAIDVPFIMSKLSCDPKVDYVRFLWSSDCGEGKAANWNDPCAQHPDTPFLHNVSRMSDRPHFATSHFYFDSIFRRVGRSYRGAPERAARGIKNAWLYGRRHEMLHDSNELQNSLNDQPGNYGTGHVQ